ncbi:MAG TPA: arsinothricin resistance N-acetyltransferase ArsN1 family B [Thermoanaerobaculia bacterium]|jgi:phosphinothricin acetyltransferase
MIRPVRPVDAEAICRVYNHYVLQTVVTFEEEAVAPEEMAGRIAKIVSAGLPWLVLEDGGALIGYAYATPWKERSGYRFAVESSIYLEVTAGGKGHGSKLYGELLAALRTRPLRTVIGGVALPNDASVRLHEKLGFRKVAHFERVGWKCGRWVDVGYWQLSLMEG